MSNNQLDIIRRKSCGTFARSKQMCAPCPFLYLYYSRLFGGWWCRMLLQNGNINGWSRHRSCFWYSPLRWRSSYSGGRMWSYQSLKTGLVNIKVVNPSYLNTHMIFDKARGKLEVELLLLQSGEWGYFRLSSQFVFIVKFSLFIKTYFYWMNLLWLLYPLSGIFAVSNLFSQLTNGWSDNGINGLQ